MKVKNCYCGAGEKFQHLFIMIKNCFYSLKYVVLLVLLGCSDPQQYSVSNEKSFGRSDVTATALTGEKFQYDEILMPRSILYKQGRLIISDRSGDNYLTHIVEGSNMKYQFPMGKIGYGPNEMSHVWTIESGFDPDRFWGYSIMDKIFSQYPLKDTPERHAIKQIKQQEDFFLAMGLTWSSDTSLMTYLVSGEERFMEFGIDGKRIKGYGKWEGLIPGDYSDYIIASVHQGKLSGNPTGDKFIKACIFRDRIEILDKKSENIIAVNGPINHIPEFSIVGSGTNESIAIKEDQPFGYLDAYFGEKNIFGLYSGKSHVDKEALGEGETEIFVFDIDGNIQEILTLNTPIISLSVDELNQKIYGITVDQEPGVVVFNWSQSAF
ncbi:BF3164 family lipoprotein [Lunatimonas salinarum]|uniref:BF3164 family lipoprotein n=1 Tax=Lunatimonas salinarum TaxID=1774590 RepID=UPI001ADFCFB3|nr:BF3164 family lipoprotein [Lunatimonas salinarum]